MNISIFIPTKNRHNYIKRTVKYYFDQKFLGQIIILDGSSNKFFKKNSEFFDECKSLNITHLKTNQLPLLAIKENLNYIENDFCSFMGDDDYLIPNGINKSINFLIKNHKFHSAHGLGIIISKPLENIGHYPGPQLLDQNAYDRYKFHFSNYATPFFSVTRKEIFIKIFNSTDINNDLKFCKDRLILDEYLFSAFYAVYGNIKRINCLHVVREHHKKRYEEKINWEKNFSNEDTITSIKYFSKIILEKINLKNTNKFNYSIYDVEKIITKSVNGYYKNTFLRSRGIKNKRNLIFYFKYFIKYLFQKLNMLEYVIKFINLMKNNKLSLENLLNKNNEYFDDFIGVYNSFNENDS